MVRKFLLILFVFILSTAINASSFDFGYSDADSSRIMVFKNEMPFDFAGFKMTPLQQYKDSNAGHMVNLNYEVKKDLTDTWDMFIDADYLTDTMLEVFEQVDLKIGAGYELFKSEQDRHKISYALVHRFGEILHSLRYKYVHQGPIFATRAIFYYVMPKNEVRGSLGTAFSITKSLAFAVNHSYISANGKTSYLSTAGFKILY